jgi:hypothetical protein
VARISALPQNLRRIIQRNDPGLFLQGGGDHHYEGFMSSVSDSVYVPRTIKPRSRRTRAAMGDIRGAIFEVLSADNPQTVRQVFYALTVRGAID